MTIISLARSLISPFARVARKLPWRRKPVSFVPVTFADMQQRRQEIYGDHVDRTPCPCPACRQMRKSAP